MYNCGSPRTKTKRLVVMGMDDIVSENSLQEIAQQLLDDYRLYLLSDGKRAKTVVSYCGDVRAFLLWLESKQVSFTGNLTRFYITSYKFAISDSHSINTYNKKINSLTSFNLFLMERGSFDSQVVFPNKDKIKIAHGSEQQVEVFSEAEVEQILFYLENKDWVNHRDKLIVLLLLYTGVRVSELVAIKVADLDILSLNLKVVGKGGKYREIPVKMELATAVKDYLEGDRRSHRFVTSDYLLLTQRSGQMNKDAVNKRLKRLGTQLSMTMKPHKFRHTFCTRLLKKGAELTTVAKLAGHANVQTTVSYYISTSQEEKQQAVALL